MDFLNPNSNFKVVIGLVVVLSFSFALSNLFSEALELTLREIFGDHNQAVWRWIFLFISIIIFIGILYLIKDFLLTTKKK